MRRPKVFKHVWGRRCANWTKKPRREIFAFARAYKHGIRRLFSIF